MEQVISIVVITYNIEDLVLETLDSVYNQTYKYIELIISDDNSNDRTAERALQWLTKHRERFVNAKFVQAKENSGIPSNCNQGIRQATGDWIKIIAGDDLFYPDAMDRFLFHIRKDPHLEKMAYHANAVEFHGQQIVKQLGKWGDPREQVFNQEKTTANDQFHILLRFNPVYAPTVLLHKSIYDRVGYFDERFKYWEDRPMWLKITSNGIKFHYIDETVVKYRRHSLSVQFNTQTMFSKTQLSMDQGYRKLIFPHLPLPERILYSYVISIRSIFCTVFKNKKTLLTKVFYKILVIVPERISFWIKKRNKP